MEISFIPQGIRDIQRWSWQPGPSRADIEQTWTHRGPGDQLGCQRRDDCQEIGLKVKLASSSPSVRDLRAHHHLSMDSYFSQPMSTPCKGFLDLLVCIQRAAAKIVVLAHGLDHIISPHAPPWHPLSSAPTVDCSSSLSRPFIIHLRPSSPTQQRPSSSPISNKPLHALSCSAAHLGEAASEHLQSYRVALLEAAPLAATPAETFTAEVRSRASLLPPAARSACTRPSGLRSRPDRTELRPLGSVALRP